MGLLDDAIREHLELKRRHGGDPEEIARQENEALGATRRAEFARPAGEEPEGEAAAAPRDEVAPAGDEVSAGDDVSAHDDVSAPEDVSAGDEVSPRDEVSPPHEVSPADEPVADAKAPVEAGDEREPFDIEAVEAKPSAAERDDAWVEDEPDEVPADEALDHLRGSEPEEEADDVLEETPDFLQETPEHDRLWFEQRPPRDFDWDK